MNSGKLSVYSQLKIAINQKFQSGPTSSRPTSSRNNFSQLTLPKTQVKTPNQTYLDSQLKPAKSEKRSRNQIHVLKMPSSSKTIQGHYYPFINKQTKPKMKQQSTS